MSARSGTVALGARPSIRADSRNEITHRHLPPPSAQFGLRRVPFPPEVITLAVRWYLRFGLSYRDVEELLAERGIKVDHVTIYRLGPTLRPGIRRGRTSSTAPGR
jgi:hypothetical protein